MSLLRSRIRSFPGSFFGRLDIAPRVALDGDKHMVALRVETLGKIALQANALDNVELPRALPEPDARRLPWLCQHMRRVDLHVEVQDIRRREMDPLDNLHVAIVRHAHRLVYREHGLWFDIDGLDDERIPLPMADGMAVEGQLRLVRIGMAAPVGVNAPKPVAVRFPKDRNAPWREQEL